ncbi:lipopolysaccharide biosynthesis protein [Pseudoalteromonas lipolytica]|jgi:PST family polysaccharide transporter
MNTQKSNGKKLVSALIHSLSGRYFVYFVQLISLMVMARTFTPEHFGFFAVIQVFSLFFQLFSEMGFAPALINLSKLKPRVRDGIFSFTCVTGFVVGVIFFTMGPAISWFYENEIYNLLVLPVAISIVFNTACILPTAALQKDRKFLVLARADALSEIMSLVAVIALSLYINPIWALAIKPMIVAIVRLFLYLRDSKKTSFGRPSFGTELYHFKSLLSFSSYQLGFNLLNYFSRNLDTILVGKYLGSANLGLYDQAYKLMRYPLLLLTFAMNPAIQPVLTTVKDNKAEFGRLHNKFILYMSMIGAIVGCILYFCSELVVQILLGDQWTAVTPLIQILSITVPIQILLSSSGGFYQAAGRADLLFKCGVFSSVVNVLAIVYGIYLGSLEALCWLLVISFSINFTQCYITFCKHLLIDGYIKLFSYFTPTYVSVLFLIWMNFNGL